MCKCDGTGWISVYSDVTLRAYREGRESPLYAVVKACTCDRGDQHVSRGTRRRPVPRYHPWCDVVCPGSPSDPENVERLKSFVRPTLEQVANTGQFADFNNR